MALFRKFFYRKPPDGLLEIAERVYVFDYCFTTDVMGEDEYRFYAGRIVSQLRAHIPDASFMVFNFREGEHQSQIDDILSEYGMTVMDYPRHYEGCPILTLEMIHHFLRSSESWLSLGPQNILLMHCERGGWSVLAFMLAGLLIYRKQFTGEQKTLDMIHKQAPRELLQLLSPLNPLPSQQRYLQYISRRNVGSKWPPLDRALTLDCVMLRTLPNFDGEGGCRPIFRIYGQDPSTSYDRTSKVLFSTQKKSKSVRHYRQADCELVKIDIHCHVQGDVVLECISLDENLRREEMMFRVMFNTAFIRSNILMLNCDEVDILWDAKDRFPKDFRAEVLFSEMDGTASLLAEELVSSKEKEGLPVEAFAKVKEIFNSVEWVDGKKGDAALHVLHKQLKSSDLLHEKLESRQKIEFKHLRKPSSHMFEEKVKLAEGANLKITKSPDFDKNDQNSRHTRPKILYQGVPKSRTNPVSSVNSLQNSSIHVSRYHSNAPSALGITALLQDHASFGSSEVAHSVIMSPSAPSLVTVTTSGLSKSASPKIASPHMPLREPKNVFVSSQPSPSQLLPPPPPPPRLQSTIHEISAPQSPTLLSMTLVKPPPQAPPPPPPPPPLPPQLPPPSFSTMFFPSSQSAETQEISASNPLKVTVLIPPPPPPPPSRQGTLVGPFRKSNINSRVHTQPLAPLSPMKRSSAPPLPPPPPPLHAGPTPSPPPPPPSPMLKHSSSSPLQKLPNVPPTPPRLAHDSFEGPDASSHPPTVMNGSSSAVLGVKVHNFRRIGSRLSTQSSAQTASLKPLHWVKVTRAMKGSLWAEAQKSDEASKTPEFDMSELQTLFSAAMPNSDHRGSTVKSSRRSSLGKKPDKVQLIDLRRANNCEIMLTKVKMPLADLMSSILALDDSILEGDQVDNLIKFCPTNEEMDLLKGFGGDRENLGKCEQYFLELMKIPRVESKLRVFSFKIQFCSQATDLRGNLNIVNSAADEIRHSAKLRRVMQTILSLGNALNQGTARGSAIGFRLDSLLKLTDMRARNNKMTLMHYLCKVIVDKLPELLDFSKDLVSLEAASKIQLKIIAEEMQAISKGLEKVEQELTDSENDGAISETFRKTLKEFLGGAEAEVRTLTSLYSNVGRNADALALYFGEDPARCPFEQVISTLFNFVRMFIRAHEENCKQIELEKRRAQKEAENENMKLLTKRKELASSLHLTNKMKCQK